MSGLPTGWATTTVACVIEDFQPGFASGQKDVEGGVPHLRMNNIGLGGELVLDLVRTVPASLARPQHDLNEGDVLVCTTNSGKLVGKCSLFNLSGRYAFSNHLTRLRPSSQTIDSSFLRWSLWQKWKSGEFDDKCKHWVNQSTLPKDALLETEISLPPLNEQRRIVAKLEAVLGKVDACQQRLAKIPVILKRFRQAVLAAACSGRLTADWREENEGAVGAGIALPRAQQAAPLQNRGEGEELPEGWQWTKLDHICTKITDGEHLTPPLVEKGVPLLSAKDVRDRSLDFSDVKFVSEAFAQKSRSRCNPEFGDILVVSRGATVGRTCRVDVKRTFCLMGSVLLFKPNQKFILPQLMEFLFKSPSGLTDLISRSSSTAQQAIYIKDMRDFPAPLPPLPEQHEIASRVEALFTLADQLEARYLKAKAHVDRLTQSILAKGFRGELVPQDENDEPAAALLERIRAVGAQQSPLTRRSAAPSPRGRGATKTKTNLSSSHSQRRSSNPLHEGEGGRRPGEGDLPLVVETPPAYMSGGQAALPVANQPVPGRNIPQAILAHMQSGIEYSRADIADALVLSTSDWTWAIRQLKEERKVVQLGERRGARYRLS